MRQKIGVVVAILRAADEQQQQQPKKETPAKEVHSEFEPKTVHFITSIHFRGREKLTLTKK
jgi:hypothetical protein